MRSVIIECNFGRTGQNYSGFVSAMEKLGARRVLPNKWHADWLGTLSALRERLDLFLGSEDRLSLSEAGSA